VLVEILSATKTGSAAGRWLRAIHVAVAERDKVVRTSTYRGTAGSLLLFGVGAPAHDAARRAHIAAGRRVVLFDLGYFGDRKHCARVSIDTDHPQQYLDATSNDPARWEANGIPLREDADPQGPVILVGLGRKSREYLRLPNWERDTLRQLQTEFPGRQIIHRPKGRDTLELGVPVDSETPIADLLRGASLAVMRHSNVAVDAAIAGVPFRCEDGAARWLQDRPFTADNRLDFLRRLAHWQYGTHEAAAAWSHIKRILNGAA